MSTTDLAQQIAIEQERLQLLDLIVKGGPGSGNFGHAGRPGEVGGSAEGGGGQESDQDLEESLNRYQPSRKMRADSGEKAGIDGMKDYFRNTSRNNWRQSGAETAGINAATNFMGKMGISKQTRSFISGEAGRMLYYAQGRDKENRWREAVRINE